MSIPVYKKQPLPLIMCSFLVTAAQADNVYFKMKLEWLLEKEIRARITNLQDILKAGREMRQGHLQSMRDAAKTTVSDQHCRQVTLINLQINCK